MSLPHIDIDIDIDIDELPAPPPAQCARWGLADVEKACFRPFLATLGSYQSRTNEQCRRNWSQERGEE